MASPQLEAEERKGKIPQPQPIRPALASSAMTVRAAVPAANAVRELYWWQALLQINGLAPFHGFSYDYGVFFDLNSDFLRQAER